MSDLHSAPHQATGSAMGHGRKRPSTLTLAGFAFALIIMAAIAVLALQQEQIFKTASGEMT